MSVGQVDPESIRAFTFCK